MSSTIDKQNTNPRSVEPIELAAISEQFDSFWEGPDDVERGYRSFGKFYRANYLKHIPANKSTKVLVISCGPGYFVNLLNEEGYENVAGIDSDQQKIDHAQQRGLNCKIARAMEELQNSTQTFDLIFCEQELNHLTKREMLAFLQLVWSRLRDGGKLICHGLNGANPITGAEALAQNIDHFNTFTEYSLKQILRKSGFSQIQAFPLNLYVFYANPLNYVGLLVTGFLHICFRILFRLYGKSNRLFTKKIGAVCSKSGPRV